MTSPILHYDSFLEQKRLMDIASGFAAVPRNESLFDFQKVVVGWALRRGRAAIFANTGLGKTLMQASWAEEVAAHTGLPVLILAPLSVAKQTVREAAKFGIAPITYVRHDGDIKPDSRIWITNYEMLDKFDLSQFTGLVLDESSILKSYDGKTRTQIIDASRVVPYRLSCTATPSPNDFMELGNQAEFVGVMSRVEMLAMFFTHDGGDTSNWRLKKHGAVRFWEWMASWSVVINSPADLGYDGSLYELPPLVMHEHHVNSGHIGGDLFGGMALSLTDQRIAKRASMIERVEQCAKLVNSTPGPWLVWCHLNSESEALAKAIPGSVAVAGSDTMAHKESAMDAFSDGTLRVLISKSSICGFGMNFQHCAQQTFVGIDHSFEMFYQAIRRSWRFGQTRQVDVHVFLGASEGLILDNLKAKELRHNEMSIRMAEHMRTMMQQNIFGSTIEKTDYVRDVATGPGWEMHLGDCVDVVGEIDSDTIDYTIFSPPFASLFTYSNSDRDMGNCTGVDEFYGHFDFLVGELLRVTKPGRLLSFHCMNLPISKQREGYIGIRDFRGELIALFVKHGWIFHSEVCIWKDPVTAMQRTKALGLLHKQIKKDSTMSRQGIPDYLVTMRKPGTNPDPVTHTNESFPVGKWQNYASPVWMDIKQSRTLQFACARDNDDERHICPLQLDVIERAIDLWTNPGDLVLSPFGGIGSEPYTAITMGRRAIAVELKQSYWEVAVKNLRESSMRTSDLFGMDL